MRGTCSMPVSVMLLAEHPEAELGRRDDRRVASARVMSWALRASRADAARTSEARTSPRSSPAASTASGTSEVSVNPGATLTSRNQHRAVGVDDQVGPGQVAQAERLVGRDRHRAHLGQHVGGQPGRDVNSVEPAV